MAGYFGTPTQQALQAQAEANAAFIAATAGACQTGRTMGFDDPERIGWDIVAKFLQRDGLCGFRLIPAEAVARLRARLDDLGYRFDTWDVFLADRATCLAASEAIVAKGLPEGLAEGSPPSEPEGPEVRALQSLMAAAGIVPFSGSLMVGGFGPAATVYVTEAAGAVVAAAHAYLPHNRFSRFHGHAWGGLVAVDEALRGKGLGSYINARMIVRAVRDLNATHVYELVSASNLASQRMVEACGLRHAPELVCGMAMPVEGGRFTR